MCECVNSCVCANVCMCRFVFMYERKFEFFCWRESGQATLQLIAGLSDTQDYWRMGEIKIKAFISVGLRPICLMLV